MYSVMTYRRRNKKRRRNKSSPQIASSSKKHRQSEAASATLDVPDLSSALGRTDFEQNTNSEAELLVNQSDLSDIRSETDLETNSLDSVDRYFEAVDKSSATMASSDLDPSQQSQSILTGVNGAHQFMNNDPGYMPPQDAQQHTMNNQNMGDPGYMSPHAQQPHQQPHPMNFAPPQMQHMMNMSPHVQPHLQAAPHSPMIVQQRLSDEDIARIVIKMQEVLGKQIDKLVEQKVAVKVASLQSEVNTLQTSLAKVQKDLKDVIVRNDDLEQYSRRSCLRISGIPEDGNDDTTRAVLDLAHRCGANINQDDIDRSHRVGRPKETAIDEEDIADISDEQQVSAKSREIIVKFHSYGARLQLLKGRKFFRERNIKIFINEDLTKTRKNLAFSCRKLRKDPRSTVAKTWVYNGNVFIQDNDDNKVRVTSLEDLNPYMPENQNNDRR